MNPIGKAVSDLFFKIPKEVLSEAFKNDRFRNDYATITNNIITEVVRSRVLVDINIVGGTEIVIPLDSATTETLSEKETIYYIQPELRQNRNITSVLSVINNNRTNTSVISSHNLGNDLQNAGQAMMNSFSSAPMISNAKVELVSENTVLVTSDFILNIPNIALRVVIEDDENLASLNKRSYLYFSKLVELAVKSYIYNKLNIKIDVGYLYGGKELSSFKSVVESYADAEQMYQEYLTNIYQGVTTLNDATTTSRLIKLMIGGYK